MFPLILVEAIKMSNKLSEGTVRDIAKTREDAKLLAECFNSFDDSDSWPGGFTGGTPITTERVLDNLQKKEDIRVLIAEVDGKIVGHCNVCQSELDPEASYVGLLGVNPEFQKRGFGKAMLIEAAETSARAGKRRVDLHTWGGNLKAVPLYKRVGYNWVPETSVLMESHIPGILNAEIFSEFFKRHNWYNSLERDITQEPDTVQEDSIGVFKYHFAGNGDTLDVVIDREAKGMCGFSRTLDGQTIAAEIKPKRHIGYIGYGEVPFSIRLKNGTEGPLPYQLTISSSDYFHIKLKDEDTGILNPNETVELPGFFSIDKAAEPLDRDKDPDIKVRTQAEFALEFGGEKILLYSGLIPTELISVTTNPPFLALSPGEKKQIGVILSSNAELQLSGTAEIIPSEDTIIDPTRERFYLEAGESTEILIELNAPDSDESDVSVLELDLKVEQSGQESWLSRQRIPIPTISPSGAVAYRSPHGLLILETFSFRIGINDQPPMALRKIWHKQTNRTLSLWGFLPALGYPFPSGGSEWDRKRFDIQIHNTNDYAEVRLQGESTETPGCKLDICFKVFPGQEYLETSIEMTNNGQEVLDNLGVRIAGWADFNGQKLYVPLRGKIYHLSSAEWSGNEQLPRKPKEYHEQWAAVSMYDDKVLLGYLWDIGEDLREIRLRRRGLPYFEYGLPNIAPSETIEKRLLRFYIGDGEWIKIRNLSANLNNRRMPGHPQEIQSDLQVGFISPGNVRGLHSESSLLLRRNNVNDIEFEIRVINETPVAVQGRMDFPNGITLDNQDTFEFRSDSLGINSPYRVLLRLHASSDASWLREGGEITLRFQNRIARIPFAAIAYDSPQGVDVEIGQAQGKKLHQLLTKPLSIAVSPDYCGGLLRISKGSEESVLYDTFPKAKPFVWWARFHSGISPIIQAEGIWDWESALPKESWKATQIELSPWTGYEMTSSLKHCPGLKDFVWRLRYLVLPGTPLLHFSVKAENKSKKWARFTFGFRGALKQNGMPLSNVLTTFNGKEQLIEPTGQHLSVQSSAQEGWICIPNSPQPIGLISTAKHRETLSFATLSDKAQMFDLSDERELYPGESTSLQGYIVLSSSCDEVKTLKNLSALIFK
ncbi:GNAT family N-acetyltransferase [Candidatus Thorarchaeota archaeon]|nr:MAG: GNAT family N-acetyltransferase [Candidatus Thorarchaeota archaeon]